MKNPPQISSFFLTLIVFFFVIKSGFASYIIRDAETEGYVRTILDEVLKAANIESKNVNLYLLKDDSINAFVSSGSDVFVHTGLIQASESYEVIQAVLAHEVGHLKAMHTLRFNSNVNKALMEALFYSVSGAVIALSGGAAAATLVGISAGMNVAERSLLRYTRLQEMEADYYAAQFLKTLKSSGKGAEKIFTKFNQMQEKAVDFKKGDEYRVTHPFPADRLEYMKNKFLHLPYTPIFDQTLERRHLFVTAKLAGYFGNLQTLYSQNFKTDASAILYFQTFSEFRTHNLQNTESKIQSLIKQEPRNPYFYEALAEMYYQKGEFKKSIIEYQKALSLKPKDFNFLFAIAETEFADKSFAKAIKYMNEASLIEPYNPLAPYKLANYYSANSENYIARIYFLESEVLKQDYSKAKVLLRNLIADIKSHDIKLEDYYMRKINDISDTLKLK